ncbi:MAG: PspC domain-containing protein [Lachnospiraceae bacterium]|nr:PspC domain-containing protein [Lachnospiraceae bacterium]
MEKRLYRSVNDKKICGVCGGIAEYTNLDPSLVRIITLLLCFSGGVGVMAYFIAALVIPENPN